MKASRRRKDSLRLERANGPPLNTVPQTAKLETIKATGAEHIGVTHGYSAVVVRWLQEQGLDAYVIPARFEADEDDSDIAGDVAGDTRDDSASGITEESD